jgi:hypothetical protein
MSRPDQAHGYIEELVSHGLIEVREGKMCTVFPILIAEDQATYARLASRVADDATALLPSDIAILLEEIRDRGWAEWQYHFVWSQVFDSQFAWVAMTRRDLVPPLGRLIAWSIYPDHPYRSGTNYFPDDALRDYWLMVTWRPDAANTVAEIAAWWRVLYALALDGTLLSAMERDSLASLGLLDSTGALQVPVLLEGDPLVGILENLAARYVEFLAQRLPVDSLTPVTGVDPRHTFAMAYHDVSWGILERLVALGRVSVPEGLTPGPGPRTPPMLGVAAIVPVESAFADLIREALQGR